MKPVLTAEKLSFLKYQGKKKIAVHSFQISCSSLSLPTALLKIREEICTKKFHYKPSFSKYWMSSDSQIDFLYDVPDYI